MQPTLLSSGGSPKDVDIVAFLRRCLLDTSMPVAIRWRAILSLRNRKGAESRQALCAALSDQSSLLAHEAAFSLGQMQDPKSIPALRTTLKGTKEFHPIVRHEVLIGAKKPTRLFIGNQSNTEGEWRACADPTLRSLFLFKALVHRNTDL